MKLRASAILVTAFLCLLPTAGWCDLAPYNQDFEGLDQADTGALATDGWLVFGNVFNPDGSYVYGYGPYPAPNDGAAFSRIAADEGDAGQGAQHLVVFSDYNNGDHGIGRLIEANVFREQRVGIADVGTTWRFEFDARRGNIEGGTTALAFFKTLDPAAGYALTNFITIDMTAVPATWNRYSLSIFIDPGLVGQILQFGFLNTATNYEGSGIRYDNIGFGFEPLSVSFDVRPASCPNPLNARSQGVLPVALLGTAQLDVNDVDVSTLRIEGAAAVRWDYDDVAAPFAGAIAGDLCGCTEAGPDGRLDLKLKFDTQDLVLASEDGRLTLTGELLDGTPIEGVDCIVVVGRATPAIPTVQGAPADGTNPVGFQETGFDVGSEAIVPNDDTTRDGHLLQRTSRPRSRGHVE